MHVSLSRTHCRKVTSLFSLAIIVLSQSDAELVIAPRDTESKVGKTSYLNCSTDLESVDIFWYHDDRYVYNGHGILEPYNGRFEIDRNASIGSHNLVIHSVKPSDAGEYTCADDDGSGRKRSAQLIVLDNDPECQSSVQPDGVIGQNIFNIPLDEVQLTCNVTYHGNIPPQLEWKKIGDNGFIKDGLTSSVRSSNRLEHTLKLKADISLDNSSYVCQAQRSIIQDQFKCTSEILKVLYFAERHTIEQNVVRGEEVTCIATNSTFPCTSQWYHDNYTCPLSCDETITTHLLGLYLCTVKCHVRGKDYYFEALKVFVVEPMTLPLVLSATAIAVPVVIVVVITAAISIAVLIICYGRMRRRRDEQRRNDDLDEIALLGFPNSDIANENHVISRNHQFLVENIKPGRLIHLLRKENCITDEEWNQFRPTNQSTDEFINDELLQLMSTIAFDGDKGQMVLKCIRQDKQDFVADLLGKGGVVIKSVISAKLVKTNKFAISSLKNVEKLKEREAIVIKRLNQVQLGLPLSEDPLDDIFIAPCCYQETNKMVFWFLCKSVNRQKRLHRMYNCGSLLEKLIKIFEQFSNDNTSVSSTSLVPTKINIRWGDFDEEIVEEEVELLGKIKNATGDAKYIVGVAILNETLFIAHQKSSELNFYNYNDFHNVRLREVLCNELPVLKVEGLVAPFDMCSCMKNNSLYISDAKSDGIHREILRIDTDGKVVARWFTHDNENGNVSATPEGNVITAVWDKQMLWEYSPTGQLKRIINLPHCTHPWHAIKLDDRYIVSHGGFFSGFNRICLVDKEGNVEKSLMHQQVDQVHKACHLAAHESSGVVIVADQRNNRVLLFDSNLEFKAKIVLQNKQRFKQPRCVSLSETSLAVQIDGGVSYDTIGLQNNDSSLLVEENCTVLVFNIKLLLEKHKD